MHLLLEEIQLLYQKIDTQNHGTEAIPLIQDIEAMLWTSLSIDDVGEQMTDNSFPEGDPIFMGTGHTHNACYMCSNSATTAGCNTCGG